MSGTVSRGRSDGSQNLEMIERPLLSPDELKSMPKGSFIVSKTGTNPMRTRLKLFKDWGIAFGKPYAVEERSNRSVDYADRFGLEEEIIRRNAAYYPESRQRFEESGSESGGMQHADSPLKLGPQDQNSGRR